MATFRPITDDERARHQRIKDHVWGEDGVPDYDAPDDVPESLGERWALVEDGEFVSICTLMEIDVSLAGEWRPVGGIRGFVTPPEHRGRSHGSRLLQVALSEFADRGLPYTLLWPESIAYYRERGWGLVHTETAYSFPPEAMADPGVEGTVERVDPDEYERLATVWRDYASDFELALRRSEAWWRGRVLDGAWAYEWTPDDGSAGGDPEGYVVYTLDRDAELLRIGDLAYRSERARRRLLAFLDRHGPQADRVEWACPEERRLLSEAADPGAVSASVEPGASGRIVDVPAAIEALPADRAPTESVTIEISDSLVEGNDGVFRVETDLTCPRVEGDVADPDVTVDVAVLSQLYAGTFAVGTAAERDLLTATDAAVAALASTFEARDVYVSDFY